MSWLAENATLVGLIFFFSIFVIILVYTLAPSRKHTIEAHGRIPLEDETHDQS